MVNGMPAPTIQSCIYSISVDHIRAVVSDESSAYQSLVEWIGWALDVAEDLDPTKGRLHKVGRD